MKKEHVPGSKFDNTEKTNIVAENQGIVISVQVTPLQCGKAK